MKGFRLCEDLCPECSCLVQEESGCGNMINRHDERFIADSMLGRLARWLRLLGVDTRYCSDIRDSDLLRIARQEGRVILTRDTHFVKMKHRENLFFVHSDYPLEQIAEVIKAYNIKEPGTGRCASCNGMLDNVDEKSEVRDAVPEYVFLNCSSFMRCHSCGKVYWEGTHLKRFRDMLGAISRKEFTGDNGP